MDPPGPPPAAWDPVAAGRYLAAVRAAVRAAEVGAFGGRFPPAVATVMAVWVEVGEGYVRDQAGLRAAGWDPLGGLRTLPAAVGEAVSNWRRLGGRVPGSTNGGGR